MEIYQLSQADFNQVLEAFSLYLFLTAFLGFMAALGVRAILRDFYHYKIAPRIYKDHYFNKSNDQDSEIDRGLGQ